MKIINFEKILERMKTILANELPICIVEKIITDEDTVEFKSPEGASYYWLVKFPSGNIPYPLMNLEGPEASPFENGCIEKSSEEITRIKIQENLIRGAYKNRPELENRFKILVQGIKIFSNNNDEFIYPRCADCAAWRGYSCAGSCGIASGKVGTPICDTMPEGIGIKRLQGAIKNGIWLFQGSHPDGYGEVPIFDFKKRIVRNALTYEESK